MSEPSKTRPLAGRVAVVTGGARGQGRAHAWTLAEDGATVYALDLLDELGAQLEADAAAAGLDVRFRHFDVTDEDAWHSLAVHIRDAHGTIDVLVNNAGVVHTASIEQESAAAFERTLRINVVGVFLGLRAAWPLLAVRGGSVINTSSVYGKVSAPGYAAYVTSKAAVLGLTRTASVEGAPHGIRVNALLPGRVVTDMLAEESGSFVGQSTPLGRGATPAELAQIMKFLASDASSFITGVDIVADGGFMAGGFSVGRE